MSQVIQVARSLREPIAFVLAPFQVLDQHFYGYHPQPHPRVVLAVAAYPRTPVGVPLLEAA